MSFYSLYKDVFLIFSLKLKSFGLLLLYQNTKNAISTAAAKYLSREENHFKNFSLALSHLAIYCQIIRDIYKYLLSGADTKNLFMSLLKGFAVTSRANNFVHLLCTVYSRGLLPLFYIFAGFPTNVPCIYN